MENLKRKIAQILERDGIYKNGDLFILDNGRYFLLKKNDFSKKYNRLDDIINAWFYKNQGRQMVRECGCPCFLCNVRPKTFDDYEFRKSKYSTVCPNAFEDVSVYCNGGGLR